MFEGKLVIFFIRVYQRRISPILTKKGSAAGFIPPVLNMQSWLLKSTAANWFEENSSKT